MGLRTFDGAVVIMTGGASGIGRTMAEELLARGAEVVLADRDTELAEQAAAELGPKARAVTLDVTDFDRFEAVIDEVFERHGRLDYLFNNAGIVIAGEVLDYTLDTWTQVLDVNVRGVVHGVQAVYRRMVEQGFGHIVNTASVAGLLPTPGIVSYGLSKHAVVGLSKGLRAEAALHNVRVSAICPGFVRTPILTGGKFGGSVDNLTPKQRAAAAEQVRPMDPHVFARQAIRAVAANKALIVLPWMYRMLWRLDRLSPGLGLSLVKLAFKRTKKHVAALEDR